ncbi:hypothetical protein BSKO_10571 [Bryopsis sp. KO-2023]|nr:hypothetical protein BSKO_10571 [Bryopsis sp. KO-2023]
MGLFRRHAFCLLRVSPLWRGVTGSNYWTSLPAFVADKNWVHGSSRQPKQRERIKIMLEEDLEKERIAHLRHIGKLKKAPSPPEAPPRKYMSADKRLEGEILEAYDVIHRGMKRQGAHTVKARIAVKKGMERMRDLVVSHRLVKRPNATCVRIAIKRLAELCLFSKEELWFGDRYSSFFEELASMAVDRETEFDLYGCAVVVWSFGKVADFVPSIRGKDSNVRVFVTKMVPRMSRHVGEMDSGIVVMALHGLANLGYDLDRDMLHRVMDQVTRNIGEYHKKSLACAIWGSARVGFYDIVGFTEKAAQRVDREFNKFSTDELCMSAWGLAKYGSQNSPLILERMAKSIGHRLEEYTPLGISRFLSACELARFDPGEEKLLSLFCQFSKGMAWLTPRILAECLLVFAHFGVKLNEIRAPVTKKYLATSSLIDVKNTAHIVGAFAMAGCLDLAVLGFATSLIARSSGGFDSVQNASNSDFNVRFTPEARCDMHRGFVNFDVGSFVGGPEGKSFWSKVRDMCREAWSKKERHRPVSPLFDEITPVLVQMGVGFEKSVLLDKVGFRVDLVLKRSPKKVAIQVATDADGFANSGKLNGDFLWREKIIRKLNLRVERVSPSHWAKLKSYEEKSKFLETFL